MPRAVSRTLLRVLDSDDFHPIDLLDIKLVGQNGPDALHFTIAGTQITWRGITYVPIGLKVGKIDEKLASTSGEIPSVSMIVSNVDSQIAKFIAAVELDGAEATLWRTDRRILTDNGPMQVVIGEVRNVALSDATLAFSIVTILGQLERVTIPRRCFQGHCSYQFGEPACGVNVKSGNDTNGIPITLTTTAQTGSTLNFIVIPASFLTAAGSPADPGEFFDGASIWLTDGPAGLQQRAFQRYELVNTQNRLWLRRQLLTIPNNGDPLTVRRKCRKTTADCQLYQGTLLNYGGFRDVPPLRFAPLELDKR